MNSNFKRFHITNATHEDYDSIYEFSLARIVRFFGETKRKAVTADIFFQSYITHRFLVRVSEKDPMIIGYAEVTNYPYIPALPEDSWMDWLSHHYCPVLPLSRGNTYFFNTFIYHPDYNPDLVRQVLCEIFYRENKVRYVIVPQCPDYGCKEDKDTPNYHCLEPFSSVYYPFCFSAISCCNTQRVHVIYRDNVIPKMRYRKALPEDNDDIVELVDLDRPDIKEQLGDYYIAEELLNDGSDSTLVVTEILHLTAGFIWLNGNVNIPPLVENYDLDLFGNLIKFNPKEKFKEKQFVVTSAKRTPINKLFTIKDVEAVLQDIQRDEAVDSVSESSSSRSDVNLNIEMSVSQKRLSVLTKMGQLMEKFNTYDYYIQLRKKRHGVLYNVSRSSRPTALDAQSNVFVIQMFGLMDPHDLRRLFRYIFTSFAAFPDRDYCLLSVSVAQTMTPTLFEMLKYMIPVIPRPGCKIDEHLFITHCSAIYGDLTLFPVRAEDVDDIKKLLSDETEKPILTTAHRTRNTTMSTIASRMSVAIFSAIPSEVTMESRKHGQAEYDTKVVTAILEEIFKDPFSDYKCYTIKCGDSTKGEDENVTVGFIILRPFNASSQLKKHFHLTHLNEKPTTNVAEIMMIKLHPLFHYQSDEVFRELARQSNCWHFYHFRPTLFQSLSNDLVSKMQPLEPRRVKKLWFCKSAKSFQEPRSAGNDASIHPINFFHDHFEAYQNNLCHSVYFGHTMNIVILGFSNICKAFLRLMLFSWHGMSKNVQKNSNCLPHVMITVICRPGVMEAEYENSFRCNICDDDENCWVNYRNCDAFVRDVTERMDVRSWVKFVSGNVKAIDTDNHLIKLESECEIYYETLLLMNYTIYGLPTGLLAMEATPANFVQINNRFDKLTFYHRLRVFQLEMPQDAEKSFVIYGNHIRAFEFVNFLVQHGIKASEITLVMPYQVANLQMGLMLNDSTMDVRVEEILREMIEDMGVQVYEHLNVCRINLSSQMDAIESVTFKHYLGVKDKTLRCDFFINYYEKYMSDADMEIFEDAEFALSGPYLLVNEKYETSDPCVYATGNFIKHRSEPNHQYRFVSPQEAAEKIINALELIDGGYPLVEDKFSKPYYFQAHLPLGNYFFKVTTPKRYMASHLDNEYGFPLVSYLGGDFTRIRLNEHGMVEEIAVVTRKNKDYDFLKFFCGRHELMLNNLRSRWFLRDVENILDFFQEAWVELLMNDHFKELQTLNKLLLLPTAHDVMKLNVDRQSRIKIMRDYCQDLGVTSQLEYAFLQFVREHREEFSPDIALPEDFPSVVKEF